MNRILIAALLAASTFIGAVGANPLLAQNREVPYWASLRAGEANMRVGPSPDYRIDWVYKRRGLPVRVVRVMEGWRLVQDHEGDQGWIAEGLLTLERGAIVVGEGLAPMVERPDASSALRWNLEPGVVGKLGECEAGWCMLNVDGRVGYVEIARLWGPGEP